MLYCADCGQCLFISDDPFYEYRNTYGWERNSIDCETGEWIDYVDGETSNSDHDYYECPHCESHHIDTEWEGDEVLAKERREIYRKEQERHIKEREKIDKQKKYIDKQSNPDREWDVSRNIIDEINV